MCSFNDQSKKSIILVFQKLINTLTSNPKRLFLIDGFGALLSAFLLGFVLVRLEHLFGIPPSVLYILATFPIAFAVYDFLCYAMIKSNVPPFLKGIANANLLYCILSITLAFYHRQELTNLGWVYIILEITIVIFLAKVELKAATILNS